MNGPPRRILRQRRTSIGQLAGRIEQPPKDCVADGYLDRGPSRAHLGSAPQACCVAECHGTDSRGIEMLMNLHDKGRGAFLWNFDGLIHRRQPAGKTYIDDGTVDGGHEACV